MNESEPSIQDLQAKIESLEKNIQPMINPNDDGNFWWSATNAMTISASVLIMGAFVIVMLGYLISKGRQPEPLLRAFGTILIIISSIFLVVAGYSDKQIAPVMGLLGTIAGYLLGKSSSPSKPSDKNNSEE